jgi:hypothetical protein
MLMGRISSDNGIKAADGSRKVVIMLHHKLKVICQIEAGEHQVELVVVYSDSTVTILNSADKSKSTGQSVIALTALKLTHKHFINTK